MSILGLVGVRVIPMCEGYPIMPQEVLHIDVGTSEPGKRWTVSTQLHTANVPSPLLLPRIAHGWARAVNPHELVLELRKFADAIEKHL